RILCPVDNSAGSRRAIAHALSLARLHGARVTALRVSEAAGDAGSLLRARRAGTPAAGDVAQLVEEWDLAGASLDVVTAAGPVADGIVRQASALDSDLIVMGMRGRMNLSYVTLGALGSVTLEVVREAPCPVM